MMTFEAWVNSELAFGCEDFVEGYQNYLDDSEDDNWTSDLEEKLDDIIRKYGLESEEAYMFASRVDFGELEFAQTYYSKVMKPYQSRDFKKLKDAMEYSKEVNNSGECKSYILEFCDFDGFFYSVSVF